MLSVKSAATKVQSEASLNSVASSDVKAESTANFSELNFSFGQTNYNFSKALTNAMQLNALTSPARGVVGFNGSDSQVSNVGQGAQSPVFIAGAHTPELHVGALNTLRNELRTGNFESTIKALQKSFATSPEQTLGVVKQELQSFEDVQKLIIELRQQPNTSPDGEVDIVRKELLRSLRQLRTEMID